MIEHAFAAQTTAAPLEQVLVTGATGAVGPTVVSSLCAAGYRVRALVRRLPDHPLLDPGVEYYIGDVTDQAAVIRAAAGCQHGLHMAALLHINNPPPALRRQYWAVNVEGTANFLAAAQQQGLQRIVFFSTIAVYGRCGTEPLTESTPPMPDSFYGESKLAAEALVLAARRADGLPLGVVLRLAAVYGSRVKGNYARLLASLRTGRFLPLGPGANQRTLIHEQDVANATLLALQHPAAAGAIYNVTDGSYYRLQEIIAAICQALGRRPPRFSIPLAPVRLAVGVVEDSLQRFGQTSPINRAMIDKYCEAMIVDGSRIQQELGFTPTYHLANGWRAVVEEITNR